MCELSPLPPTTSGARIAPAIGRGGGLHFRSPAADAVLVPLAAPESKGRSMPRETKAPAPYVLTPLPSTGFCASGDRHVAHKLAR